jgi:rhodanese-related sulfurtransferase
MSLNTDLAITQDLSQTASQWRAVLSSVPDSSVNSRTPIRRQVGKVFKNSARTAVRSASNLAGSHTTPTPVTPVLNIASATSVSSAASSIYDTPSLTKLSHDLANAHVSQETPDDDGFAFSKKRLFLGDTDSVLPRTESITPTGRLSDLLRPSSSSSASMASSSDTIAAPGSPIRSSTPPAAARALPSTPITNFLLSEDSPSALPPTDGHCSRRYGLVSESPKVDTNRMYEECRAAQRSNIRPIVRRRRASVAVSSSGACQVSYSNKKRNRSSVDCSDDSLMEHVVVDSPISTSVSIDYLPGECNDDSSADSLGTAPAPVPIHTSHSCMAFGRHNLAAIAESTKSQSVQPKYCSETYTDDIHMHFPTESQSTTFQISTLVSKDGHTPHETAAKAERDLIRPHKRRASSTDLFGGMTLENDTKDSDEDTLQQLQVLPRTASDPLASVNELSSDEWFAMRESSTKLLALPTIGKTDGPIPRIEAGVLADMVQHQEDSKYFGGSIKRFIVIDCRYWFEYQAGHIPGAFNINTRQRIEKLYQCNKDFGQEVALIFHCEFSQHRAPKLSSHFREVDRAHNEYPKLTFPNVYVMDGGYKNFWSHFDSVCTPHNYLSMWDERYNAHNIACKRAFDASWQASDSENETVPRFRRSRGRHRARSVIMSRSDVMPLRSRSDTTSLWSGDSRSNRSGRKKGSCAALF